LRSVEAFALSMLIYPISFRERPDTIRCIVSNLVGDGSDLLEENEQVLPIQALNEPYEDYGDPMWDPEPNDAEPGLLLHFINISTDQLIN
jgi:hypothetical protein